MTDGAFSTLSGFALGRRPATVEVRPMGFVARPDPKAIAGEAGEMIVDDGDGHALVLAPTGAGKKRNVLAATLLKARNPAIVLDVKGELARETAAHRRDVLGHEVRILDPWKIATDAPDSFNPLDLLDPEGPEFGDDAYALARLLQDTAPLKEAYWDESAQSVVAGLIAHAALGSGETDRSFGRVWSLANADDIIYGLAVLLDTQKVHPFARAQIAGLLALSADNTRSCILSVMQQHLRVFSSDAVKAAVEKTSFDLDAVREGRPLTIYVCVPLAKLHSHAALLRMWLGALMDLILTRTQAPPLPTLMLLDEVGQLGRMDQVLQAVTLARGFGLRCMLLLQSLAALRRAYPADHEVLLENCGAVLTFGHGSFGMSRQMSEMLGDVSADRLFAMGAGQAALRLTGRRTQIVDRLDYLNDPDLVGLAAPDRMASGGVAARG